MARICFAYRLFFIVICAADGGGMEFSMRIDIKAACGGLLSHDNILILAHRKPDGDTLGSSFALLYALQSLGKKARVLSGDGFPERYSFLYGKYAPDMSFEPEYLVAVDVAGLSLLGPDAEDIYGGKIDLCIDHHKSNTLFAKHTLLDPAAPAAAQLMFEVVNGIGANIDSRVASALFTGITTDTGCFRYANVTAKAHRTAAELIERGADHAKINKLMFDTKSMGMMMLNGMMAESVKLHFEGRCALVVLPADITDRFNVSEGELDGISAFPVRIEGVLAGLTVRAKENGVYRTSVRTVPPVDASKICEKFGGGGHTGAAGCTLNGDLDDAVNRLLAAVEDELNRIEKTP